MPIAGYIDYKRREYCNDIKCPVQIVMNRKKEGTEEHNELREICKTKCLHTTYEFHHWLTEKGFQVVRQEK